jgi:predicted phosphodiesterase
MSMAITNCRVKTIVAVICFAVYTLPCAGFSADSSVLTFFGWSDQHVKTDGDGRHLVPAIDAMNNMPGTAYPTSIGGNVEEPNFVMGCGDITEWPTLAARDTYEQLITTRLRFRSYDVAGNHDSGGLTPSSTIHDWLIKRHGTLSYTFDKKCVHFIALYSKYDESLNNPAQPISQEALEYLKKDLVKVPKGTPVVVATHLCFDAITNRDEFIDAFADANVILVLGGHYHKAAVNKYRGINFVQLPSPAAGSPNEITVIRIDAERLIAVPFDYESGKWSNDPKKILDTPITRPRTQKQGTAATATGQADT